MVRRLRRDALADDVLQVLEAVLDALHLHGGEVVALVGDQLRLALDRVDLPVGASLVQEQQFPPRGLIGQTTVPRHRCDRGAALSGFSIAVVGKARERTL